MCLIIDKNVAPLVFGGSSEEFRPIIDWLTSSQRNGRLVIGGHLKNELFEINNAKRFIIQLIRAGRARDILENVEEETERVKNLPELKSDDPHIIALARMSGARILCSHDVDLRKDFRNHRLISDPRGHIYQSDPLGPRSRIYQNTDREDFLNKYGHTKACGQG
jgi:hypothetical protein